MFFYTVVVISTAVAVQIPPPAGHFTCQRASSPVVIDGRADEAAWQRVDPITDFRLWRTYEPPTETTSVKLCYDDTCLYALFECADPDVFALYDQRDARLWESDVVELFFQPNPADPTYYEFEFAPNNTVFDARMLNTGSGGFRRWAAWNCGVRTAAAVRGTINDPADRDVGYTIEVAIPLEAFGDGAAVKPLEGRTWKFAAVRVDLSVTLESEERSSTANVPDGDIHQKDGYSTLTFVEMRMPSMQVFRPFLNGYFNAHVQLWEHIKEKTFAALGEHAALKEAMDSAGDVSARGAMIRRTFLESIGGLPAHDTPLNPQVLGSIQRPGYRIEKVIFESQPKVYVSSLLYIPDGLTGPAPGILFLSGHHREAKINPEYQRCCQDFVVNGFVVLATDPTGQGERVTHLDPDSGKMVIDWGTTEHSYQGQQCILTGTSIARYFLIDAIRGLDYLQSRPEVDPERLGVTGNSGGGTQTSLLCMTGDERVKAAVPCTYVTSREHYFCSGQAQDAEQIQFAMTKNGINYDDMFLPIAPRPLLLGAVASDFFPPEGTELTCRRLKRIYGLFGREADVDWFVAPGHHMYCKELRQAAVNWFRRYLMAAEPSFVSKDDEGYDVLPDEELWCTAKGHILSQYPDGRTPFDLNLDCVPERPAHKDSEALRGLVIDTLCIRERLDAPCEPFPRTFEPQTEHGLTRTPVFFRSETGIMVAGCLIHAEDAKPSRAVIALGEGGTTDLGPILAASQDVLDAGDAIFVYDVRGTGAVCADAINARGGGGFPSTFYDTDNWLSFLAYCAGDCLLGMRVFDVLRAADYLRACGFEKVDIHGTGLQPALWAYLAGALDPGIARVRADGLIESYEAIARTELYRTDYVPAMMVHGILRHFDLPDLKLLFKGRDLTVTTVPVALVP